MSTPYSVEAVTKDTWVKWETEAEDKRKELEDALKKMASNPRFMLHHVLIGAGPANCPEFHPWCKRKISEVMGFLLFNKHKINGEWGHWSNGSFGSRWCDVRLADYDVRLSFHSRKYDPGLFAQLEATPKQQFLIIATDYFQGKDEGITHVNWTM